MQLHAFDYLEASRMLEGYSREDIIRFYCCLGGPPHYLAQVDKTRPFEENLHRLYFDLSGYLYNEPMMLLQQELREPAMYNAIIGTIAGGASRLNDIATRLDEEGAKVAKYLRKLSGTTTKVSSINPIFFSDVFLLPQVFEEEPDLLIESIFELTQT